MFQWDFRVARSFGKDVFGGGDEVAIWMRDRNQLYGRRIGSSWLNIGSKIWKRIDSRLRSKS